jgi:hypothetical protein
MLTLAVDWVSIYSRLLPGTERGETAHLPSTCLVSSVSTIAKQKTKQNKKWGNGITLDYSVLINFHHIVWMHMAEPNQENPKTFTFKLQLLQVINILPSSSFIAIYNLKLLDCFYGHLGKKAIHSQGCNLDKSI